MSEANSPAKDNLRRKSRRVQTYQKVFDGPDGRWVLKDLMRRFHFFEPTTVAGDPYGSRFLDGQRSVVMDIQKTVATDLGKLIELYESLPEDESYG